MLKKLAVFSFLALLACARVYAVQVTVEQVDGEDVSGILTKITADSVTAGATVPLKEVGQIKFPGAASTGTLSSPLVVLRNQDSIAQVTIVSASDTKIRLKTSWLGEFEIEYKAIDALVFYNGTAKKMPEGLESILKAPPPGEDQLVTVKGETISGFYEKMTEKEITFNAGGQSRPYPFEQLAALRLAMAEKYEANKALTATLTLVDGSRLSIKPDGLEGENLKVQALDNLAFKIHEAGIVSLKFGGGRLVYLSALTPKNVEQKPYVGGAAFVFTWRKDRSCANGPLKIGDVLYEKGLGVHSYCKLSYDLNGEYAKFMADVGMDASAPAKAACGWKVLVDGKEVAGGVAKAMGGKTAVKADVTGAKMLELICDYGPDDDDAGDRLDFAKARVIKP